MFRKLLLIGSTASLLALTSTQGLAGDERWDKGDRREYRNEHRNDNRKGYRNEHRRNDRKAHNKSHRKAVKKAHRNGYQQTHYKSHRNGQRWDRGRGNAYRGGYWRHGRYYNPRYSYYGPYGGWGQAYLGGALLGSAITYGLSHNHATCNDSSHNHDPDGYREGPRYEIEGCYRIEKLPDGSERRVELPLS
ncbi:MAG: hypothetical protein ACI87W_003567, partial [Halieaceae bacterium]